MPTHYQKGTTRIPAIRLRTIFRHRGNFATHRFRLLSSSPQLGSGTFLPGGRPPVNVSRKGGRSPNSERFPQRTPQWQCEARRGGCQACRGPSDCLCQLTRHARMSAPGTTRKSQCRTNVAEWRTSSSFRCSLPQSRRNCEGPGSTLIPPSGVVLSTTTINIDSPKDIQEHQLLSSADG